MSVHIGDLDGLDRIVVESTPGLDRSRLLPGGIGLGKPVRDEVEIETLDTEDADLGRAGVFVRRVDGEWLVECGRYGTWRTPAVADEVTPALAFVLDGVRRGKPLGLRPRVIVRRRTWPLVSESPEVGSGAPMGRICEETQRTLDGKRAASPRTYLTVEGPRDVVDAVRHRMIERGLGRREVDRPSVSQTVGGSDPSRWQLEKDLSAEKVIRRSIARAVDRLVAHDPVTRADIHPEGVHQMRVAVRSIRSTMRTFAPLIGPSDDALLGDLRWLGELLGEVRDLDVLMAGLEESAAQLAESDRAVLPALVAEASGQRTERLAVLLEAMGGDRYRDLIARLDALNRSIEFARTARRPAEATLRRFARRAFRRLRRAVESAERKNAVVEDVHVVRLLAKKFRYSLDAVAEVSADAMAQSRALARFQDTLGEYHDAVVAQEWLRSLTEAEEDPGTAFVIGQLVALQRDRMDRSRRDMARAWRRTARRRTRAWLEN